jgi:hypothetical protein
MAHANANYDRRWHLVLKRLIRLPTRHVRPYDEGFAAANKARVLRVSRTYCSTIDLHAFNVGGMGRRKVVRVMLQVTEKKSMNLYLSYFLESGHFLYDGFLVLRLELIPKVIKEL